MWKHFKNNRRDKRKTWCIFENKMVTANSKAA